MIAVAASCVYDISNKWKCVLRCNVVNVLGQPESIPALPVVVVGNSTPAEEPCAPAPTNKEMAKRAFDAGMHDRDHTVDVAVIHHAFLHTSDQKWTVALLKILDDMHAPDYAFGHILGWARG